MKAWADTEVLTKWVEHTLAQSVQEEPRFALFCDNLTVHQSTDFQRTAAKLGAVVWYDLPIGMDLYQVLDAEPSQLIKTLIA